MATRYQNGMIPQSVLVRHGTHFQSAKTHCKRGHPFEGPNVIVSARGHRTCRACGRERANATHEHRPFDLKKSNDRYDDIMNGLDERGRNWSDMQTGRSR